MPSQLQDAADDSSGSVDSEPEPSPSQILDLGKAMDGETTSAILERLARVDAAARAEGEKAEYDAAAAEAARDLYDDYGESPAQRTPMQ